MGVFSDTIANRKTFTPSDRIYEWLGGYVGGPNDREDAGLSSSPTVISVAAVALAAGGALDLNFAGEMSNGNGYDQTISIDFDDNTAAIQGKFNSAFGGAGYTSGDASVSGDIVTGITVTFATRSFADVPAPVVETNTLVDDMDGPLSDPAITVDQEFEAARPAAWGVLNALGVLTYASVPPTDFAAPYIGTRGANFGLVKPDIVQELAREIAEQESDSRVYLGIMRALGYQA